MELAQLDTTNVLLGIIAGMATAQMIALVVAALWLKRTLGNISHTVATFGSEHLGPLAGEARQLGNQARLFVAELHAIVHRGRTLVDGIDLRTRRAMATVDAVNERVDAVVSTAWNQVHALESGLRQGVRALVRSARRVGVPVSDA